MSEARSQDGPPRGVNIIGWMSRECGLATACRMNAEAIKAAGYETVENDYPTGLLAPNRCTVKYNTNYFHFQPDHWQLPTDLLECLMEGRRNIAYWAWETSRAPDLYLAWTKKLDQVWVPSRAVADALRGAHCPVHVVPHAIVVPEVQRVPMTRRLDPTKNFCVLFCFDGKSRVARKNPFGAIQAFQLAFPADNDVRLMIKCHAISRETRDALGAIMRRDPRIVLVEDYTSAAGMDRIYDLSHVFLSLHRGEGFGLHLAEAMAHRMVVISTHYGGPLDFILDGQTGLTVPRNMVPVDDDYYGLPGAQWAEPDLAEAARTLEFVKRRWETKPLETLREDAARYIRVNFSRANLIKRIQQLLA